MKRDEAIKVTFDRRKIISYNIFSIIDKYETISTKLQQYQKVFKYNREQL